MKQIMSLTIAALIVSACSPGVETRITSSGVTSPKIEPYMISALSNTSAALQPGYALVGERLAAKGFVNAAEAPLHLEVTVDERDASLALGSSEGRQSLAASKRKKPLQSCADREFRLGVTLTRVADGVEIYRGRAAEYHCKMSVTEALPALVDAALADFGQPHGSYIVKRNAKE
jgi:hypothetical protein